MRDLLIPFGNRMRILKIRVILIKNGNVDELSVIDINDNEIYGLHCIDSQIFIIQNSFINININRTMQCNIN